MFINRLYARTIQEYDKLFFEADKIQLESINPLNLEGKPVSEGMRLLTDIGYECSVVQPLKGFKPIYGVACDKSNANEYCAISSVDLGVSWGAELSDNEVIALLEKTRINSIFVSCIFSDGV